MVIFASAWCPLSKLNVNKYSKKIIVSRARNQNEVKMFIWEQRMDIKWEKAQLFQLLFVPYALPHHKLIPSVWAQELFHIIKQLHQYQNWIRGPSQTLYIILHRRAMIVQILDLKEAINYFNLWILRQLLMMLFKNSAF